MSFFYFKIVLAYDFLKPGFCFQSPLGAFQGIRFEKKALADLLFGCLQILSRHGFNQENVFPFFLPWGGKLSAQVSICTKHYADL